MKSKVEFKPIYPKNGNLRMYNMFPYRRYAPGQMGITGMTHYIPEVAAMNYNAVWINPLQVAGTLKRTHPDGCSEVSGSLYAMTDDEALNPLIFPVPEEVTDPGAQQMLREEQLKNWTQEVRRHNMHPLFDLVLNHIGIDEGKDSPLKLKLQEEGKKRGLNLLIPEINERWPDIQAIDYYQDNLSHQKRGLNAEPKDLDFHKIDAVFEILWEPLIRRYIQEYGFMGIRVDALTHVPVPVQQRAIQLVQKLVQETYHTNAVVVGELMIGNPEDYLSALSACGLTHCLHPCGFYWGYNKEGGYNNSNAASPFIKQNEQLPSVVFTPTRHLHSLTEIVILNEDLNQNLKHQKNTIYLFKQKDKQYLALNFDDTDICFNKALILPIEKLGINSLSSDISAYHNCTLLLQQAGKKFAIVQQDYNKAKENKKKLEISSESSPEPETHPKSKNKAKKKEKPDELDIEFNKEKMQFVACQKKLRQEQINVSSRIISTLQKSELLQQKLAKPHSSVQLGGLIGVVGNHDVGTLKAKIMLDIAYNRALMHAGNNQEAINIENTYNQFKQGIIKGIRNTDELMEQLQKKFGLSELEKKHLFLELNMRMREKIFIQSMMCTGGWYSLGGDEFGVCHKPEVFREFAESGYVGSSLTERRDSPYQHHDFRGFIRSINLLLKSLPASSYQDKTSLHYAVLSNEVFGEKPADLLFMVLHYNARTKQYYLMGHCNEKINPDILLTKMSGILTNIPACEVYITDKNGTIDSWYYSGDVLAQDPLTISYFPYSDRFFPITAVGGRLEKNRQDPEKTSGMNVLL